jgi:putative DNA primase/helicase
MVHKKNGKGTIFEILKFVLGEFAYKSRSEVFLESRYHRHAGLLMLIPLLSVEKDCLASETGDGRSLNAAKLKELCGGDTLKHELLMGNGQSSFSPTHLLFLLTNERPVAPANDDALWERIHLIPFNIDLSTILTVE